VLALRDWFGCWPGKSLVEFVRYLESVVAYLDATLATGRRRRLLFFVRRNSTPATIAFLGVGGAVSDISTHFVKIPLFMYNACCTAHQSF
jgi:hypothetical protein